MHRAIVPANRRGASASQKNRDAIRDEVLKMTTKPHFPESVHSWLKTRLGSALLEQESRLVEESFDGIFGEQCLQLGLWGDRQTFLKHSRTQRKWLIEEGIEGAGERVGAPEIVGAASSRDRGGMPLPQEQGRERGERPLPQETGPAAIGHFHRLPVQDGSVDCVLLPHVLDYSDRPHAILREVDRVLTAHGHLAILGFKPGGLWGVRRLVRGAELPPEAHNLVPERRLRDWLQLLNMQIHGIQPYFFRWPVPGKRGATAARWEQRGRNWWPAFAACYILTAQKRVSTLTPVRPVWSSQPKTVGGLAGTTNRVSKIRFDKNPSRRSS
jgi:SAM-dependent methyltransferase